MNTVPFQFSPEHWERNINIARSIINGATYKEAGALYGVSAARATQIFYKFARNLRVRARYAGSCSIQEMRKNPEPWLRVLDQLEGLEQGDDTMDELFPKED